jgi:hypothetical protein
MGTKAIAEFPDGRGVYTPTMTIINWSLQQISRSNLVKTRARCQKLSNSIERICEQLTSHMTWCLHLNWSSPTRTKQNGRRVTIKNPGAPPQAFTCKYLNLQKAEYWWNCLTNTRRVIDFCLSLPGFGDDNWPLLISKQCIENFEEFLRHKYKLIFGMDTNGYSCSIRAFVWDPINARGWDR